ncbi:MAG: lysylphosphatidylglycerol synthase domain-containing protein [Planctomycetaceae bacterium]
MDAGPDRPDDVGTAPSSASTGWLRRVLTVLFVLAAFAFLGLAVARDWEALRAHDWSVQPLRLVLSFPPLLAAFGIGVYTWRRTLDALGGPATPFPTLLRIWFLSTLARYIPGKIWQFVGTAKMAADAGLPPTLLLTSLLVSMGFNVVAAAAVGAATIPGAGFLPAGWRTPLLLGTLGLAALTAHPAFLNACLRLVPRALHHSVLTWDRGWGVGIRLLLLSALGWIVYGLGFWLFVAALTDVDASAIAPLSGVNALAFLAGYVVIVAPAGLGVRELSMAALLQPFVPGAAGIAAVIAIASRLWIVAGELLGTAVVLLLTHPPTPDP